MKIACLSDMHGNIHAFRAVIKDLENYQIDRVVLLGDYVGDYPFHNEVVDLIQTLDADVIIGNREDYLFKQEHDQTKKYKQFNTLYWNYNMITTNNYEYLKKLNKQFVLVVNGKRILFSHSVLDVFSDTAIKRLGSPDLFMRDNDVHKYIKDLDDEIQNDQLFMNKLDALDADAFVFGHSHIQFHLDIKGKKLINAGSVGCPLDYNQDAAYAIITIQDDLLIEERRVRYDYNEVVKETLDSSLYQESPVWTSICLDELVHAEERKSFFFRYVKEKLGYLHFPIEDHLILDFFKQWEENKEYYLKQLKKET